MDTPSATHRGPAALHKDVDAAVDILREGGVVCVPTDTLYGLAALAFDESAVERIFSIKGRAAGMALPLLLAEPDDMFDYAVDVPPVARRLAARLFPGPITLVLRSAERLPAVVRGGKPTVAVRVPDHWVPREIARRLGGPITGTSANRTGTPSPTTAGQVRRELGGEVDRVIDAGPSGGVESTVLDVTRVSPVILREGAVSREEIEEACGTAVASKRAG